MATSHLLWHLTLATHTVQSLLAALALGKVAVKVSTQRVRFATDRRWRGRWRGGLGDGAFATGAVQPLLAALALGQVAVPPTALSV